ncbi:MAG: tyrosine-type recombinase/integrase [Brevinema sp.]
MINGVEYRKSLKTENKRVAQELYNQWNYQYQVNKMNGTNEIPLIDMCLSNKKDPQSIIKERPSLEKAFREHLRVSQNNFVSEYSIAMKESLLELLNSEKIEWDDITPERMIDFQENLRVNYAHSTVDKHVTHLKAFLKFAVKRDYFNEHDRVRLEFLKRSKPTKAQSLITDTDFQKMLDHCKNKGDLDFMYYLMTLFFTASRPNEIVKMTHKDIDFDNLRVSIWMNKTQRHKHVAFDKTFLDELMGIMKYNELTNGCLFLGSCRNKEFYAKKFRDMRDTLRLNDSYTLYSFRRTAGTKCLEFCQNIHLVAEFLGHEDIRTTQKSYILDNPERTRPLHNHLKDIIYPKKNK